MNSHFQYKHNPYQRGSALMVAMVLIFMISIMGVSVMRNSSLEHRMATNSIQSATVFQAAESVVEMTLNDTNSLTAAFTNVDDNGVGQPTEWDVTLNGNNIPGLTSDATIRFTRLGIAEGWSPELASALYFETLGASTIPAVRAEAAVIRGASRVVPKSQ